MTFPALKLLWSPGSVLAHHRRWPLHDCVPIPKTGLTFGIEGDVRALYLKAPCRLGQDLGLTCQDKALVNGAPARRAKLAHRDLFEAPGGTLFRVLEKDDIEASSSTLEAAIESGPDDDEVVQVWRDFLLDQGDPLGERIARARAGEATDDAQWLDMLAPHYQAGRLDVSWKNGLASRAVLRETEFGFASLKEALGMLLSLRVMRFLRELVVDLSSDRLDVKEGLAALAAVRLPATLCTLSLGDVPESYRGVCEAALASFGRPVEIGYFTGAQLEVLRSTVSHFQRGERITVGEAFSYAGYHVQREGPRYRLSSVRDGDGRPKVHGKRVDALPLRDADVIELGPELSMRFTLLR